MWRSRGGLDDCERKTILGLYNTAGRSLFRSCDPAYFEAAAAQRSLGLPLPLHTRVVPVLAYLIGLKATLSLLRIAGRT